VSLLLAADVGNTHIVFGVFRGEKLLDRLRVSTLLERTEDEYRALMENFLQRHGWKAGDVTGVVLSNVVPSLTPILENFCRQTFGLSPLMVRPGIKTGISILYDNPQEVGADRIVNAVAVSELYKVPAVVVDFGTATTFDVVSAKKEYLGGVIAPGLALSAEALFRRAARLPRVELARPSKVVATNTVESMQSGLYHGYASLVRGILAEIRRERGEDFFVAATGGLAETLAPALPEIQAVDQELTLKGLRILHERNR
jgi:type III pantothenate kinase